MKKVVIKKPQAPKLHSKSNSLISDSKAVEVKQPATQSSTIILNANTKSNTSQSPIKANKERIPKNI